ncbi:glycosyltransferase family 4 protein [Sphingomonas sp. AR_OL41]|uniref:glycosyltransferase family 4 protein n=1 Tax=Sphingomonas sp. AR_OL41 TaxID=3042729 RepID=UPI0024817144|nr:glycosyltransferase family 4 protein [Sphingomonas sp. AR_OL41]MDH7974952.1 glycosyltransferase family 4 protein [Sphingomonas sp. AR_OL41]
MKSVVVLISPAAVDAYPPVQAQARLLADAGFEVQLLTSPRRGRLNVEFCHTGVIVTSFVVGAGRARNLTSYTRMIAKLSALRMDQGKRLAAEISFDPNGMALGNLALGRRPRRVAHFHETLGTLPSATAYARMRKRVTAYDLVVVADSGRAPLLQKELDLPIEPTVIPNYPLSIPVTPSPTKNPEFEVIYGGSIDFQQRIDLVIQSVVAWPTHARLTLLGDDSKPQVAMLKEMAARFGDRVIFHGWIETGALIERYRRAHLGISLLNPAREQWRLSVGASNKRYQYMQAGLAQIGDKIAGVPELVEGNGIGRVVADYTPESIAAIVNYYAAHPEQAAAEGERAEALHRLRYNYQQAFAPILDWVAAGRT